MDDGHAADEEAGSSRRYRAPKSRNRSPMSVHHSASTNCGRKYVNGMKDGEGRLNLLSYTAALVIYPAGCIRDQSPRRSRPPKLTGLEVTLSGSAAFAAKPRGTVNLVNFPSRNFLQAPDFRAPSV
jgi:hypothetical protein